MKDLKEKTEEILRKHLDENYHLIGDLDELILNAMQEYAQSLQKESKTDVEEVEKESNCKYVKREGESCTLNDNCKYPNCEEKESGDVESLSLELADVLSDGLKQLGVKTNMHTFTTFLYNVKRVALKFKSLSPQTVTNEEIEEMAKQYAVGKSSAEVFRETHIEDYTAGAKALRNKLTNKE